MKKTTVIWLLVVFAAGIGGFAIGDHHNKPRVLVARELVNNFIWKDPNGDVLTDKYAAMKSKFENHLETYRVREEEQWKLYNDIPVNVIYDIREDRVIIHCKKIDPLLKKCVK